MQGRVMSIPPSKPSTQLNSSLNNISSNIIKNRDEILNSANLDINKWINDEYTDIELDLVIEKIKYNIIFISHIKITSIYLINFI